jgi:hypothetical protein
MTFLLILPCALFADASWLRASRERRPEMRVVRNVALSPSMGSPRYPRFRSSRLRVANTFVDLIWSPRDWALRPSSPSAPHSFPALIVFDLPAALSHPLTLPSLHCPPHSLRSSGRLAYSQQHQPEPCQQRPANPPRRVRRMLPLFPRLVLWQGIIQRRYAPRAKSVVE